MLTNVCLGGAFAFVPPSFPAERLVVTYDTGRRGERRYRKERLEVIDATHFYGRIRRLCWGELAFWTGLWHASQIDASDIVRVEAYSASFDDKFGKLLNTFVRPGCGIPA